MYPTRKNVTATLVGALVVCLLSTGLATASSRTSASVSAQVDASRATTPEDRYAMAGGCYALKAPDGAYVSRSDGGFAATATSVSEAEPFRFQATDLGRYLLFGSAEDFVAAGEGALARAGYAVTRSNPGAIAGGVAFEQTDAAADAVADSELNRAAGRGASVVAAPAPSDLADWSITGSEGTFQLALPETDQSLVVSEDKTLALADGPSGDAFNLELTSGCAEYPEIEVNVDGSVVGGDTSYEEVSGYLDTHLHMMAFEFLGGRARCGRPWHRFGAPYALVDCPDHEHGGYGALLENLLRGGTPPQMTRGHDTDGWPTFAGWPIHNSLTHEQAYYKWLERAWRGGLRMFTNLLVDNNQLCKIYPFKRNSCNEMDGVRLQARRIRQLQDYIDAQSGGPGEGWFRIVTDPFQAREVINQGKLAVVLGIEVSVPFDCGLTPERAGCDVEKGLDEVYDLGVRQMEMVNKFDNALSGVAGDGGATGVVVNQGNKGETGHYWKMETCGESDGHAHDKTQINFHDDSPAPKQFSERDSLAGAIFSTTGKSGVAPVYPQGPHCNVIGLSPMGEQMIRGMAERGMIFDPDHMSARAQTQALDLLETLNDGRGYSGVVSSHGWSNSTIYPRVYGLGGVVTPYAGGSAGFVEDWRAHKPWADSDYYFGFGFGSDVNGFGSQGGPRANNASNPVTYPFTGFGGVTVHRQQSGTRAPYDINVDGVAHYGLYPDWIEDLRLAAGEDGDELLADMARGPEAYLQMWERAIGIAPDACRTDIADLTTQDMERLRAGMSPTDVLRAIGQPTSRQGTQFTYCVEGGRRVLEFSPDGALVLPAPEPTKTPKPAKTPKPGKTPKQPKR